MVRSLVRKARSLGGYATSELCIAGLGGLLFILAAANIAFAAAGGPCEGVLMKDTNTGQIQGPWCHQGTCANSCYIEQVTCDSVQGTACACNGASPPVVCEAAKTPTGSMCCPKNCPAGKKCESVETEEFPGDPANFHDGLGHHPPGDTSTTDWIQCRCH